VGEGIINSRGEWEILYFLKLHNEMAKFRTFKHYKLPRGYSRSKVMGRCKWDYKFKPQKIPQAEAKPKTLKSNKY